MMYATNAQPTQFSKTGKETASTPKSCREPYQDIMPNQMNALSRIP